MHDLPAHRRRRATPRESASQEPPPGAREPADAFEIWLRNSLRQAFDDVASEPVPDDLLRMIEEDRAERERLRRRRQGLPEE